MQVRVGPTLSSDTHAVLEGNFATPSTWDTSVVPDRIAGAQTSWLAAHYQRHSGAGMSSLTALALRGHTWTVAHAGDTRAYLVRGTESCRHTQNHCLDHPDATARHGWWMRRPTGSHSG